MERKSLSHLTALTHLDGRNSHKVAILRNYFSEYAWMKRRFEIMVRWLEFLSDLKIFPVNKIKTVQLSNNFSIKEAAEVQEIEKTTNHDLKAIEYYLRKILTRSGMKEAARMTNFGLGSEDINNIAFRLAVKEAWTNGLLPELRKLIANLNVLTRENKDLVMLGRTHGKEASVTTLGKELGLYLIRIVNELMGISKIDFTAKISGEVGNYNALEFVLPEIDWLDVSNKFISSFSLRPNLFTTQINSYDDLITFFDSLKRMNYILLGFSKDIWLYSLIDYLTVIKVEKEVGSAGMPHKVNPLYFEGAEGGFEMASANLELLSRKLSYSRLQRDFSDSTVRRNISYVFGITLLSFQSLNEGMKRIKVNRRKIDEDLKMHYEVLSEGIQTLLRYKGNENAYEKVKMKMRGRSFSKNEFRKLLEEEFPEENFPVQSLKEYKGLSVRLVDLLLKEVSRKIARYE